MTGFEACELYHAIKLHFTADSYDYFKYGGKTRFKPEHFESRKDKYFFLKLSRKYKDKDDFIFFLVSLFVDKDYKWVGDLLTGEAENAYMEKQKIFQSLSYIFQSDCSKMFDLVETPNQLLMTNGDLPYLLVLVQQKEIHLETLCILNKILGFLDMWKSKIEDDLLWPILYRRIWKYSRFIEIDEEKYKKALKNLI